MIVEQRPSTRSPVPIRALHVIDHLAVGGAQQLLVEFAEHALARQIQMSLVVLDTDLDVGLKRALVERGCAVHVLGARRGQVLLDRSLPRRLAGLLVVERADVMHAHLEYGTIIGVEAARRAGVPPVVTIHSTVVEFGRGARLKEVGFDRALRQSSHVIACGESVAVAHHRRCGSTPLTVVTNPVPTRSPAPFDARFVVRGELGVDGDDVVVVSVGRVTEEKGALDLVEAFAAVTGCTRRAHLVYAGEGPEVAEVSRRAANANISDRVHLLGHRDDVTSVLAAADVYASAAHREGLPLAMLEAMHAQVAVVATDVGDVGAVLGKDRGVVVQPRRTEELAGALGDLIDDAPRRAALAAAAGIYLADRHDAGLWVDLHRTVYEQVVGRAHPVNGRQGEGTLATCS